MRAVFAEQAGSTPGIAESHEIFAQEAHPNRRAVRSRDLFGQQGRDPVSPHQLAHRRLTAYAGEQIVFSLAQHCQDRSKSGNGLRCNSQLLPPGVMLRKW